MCQSKHDFYSKCIIAIALTMTMLKSYPTPPSASFTQHNYCFLIKIFQSVIWQRGLVAQSLTCSRSPVSKTERNTTQSDRRGEVKKNLVWIGSHTSPSFFIPPLPSRFIYLTERLEQAILTKKGHNGCSNVFQRFPSLQSLWAIGIFKQVIAPK